MKTVQELEKYEPLLEGVTSLFYPFVEAAMHDLQTGRIVAIYNNVSKRNVGDPSPLSELGMPVEKFPDVFEPYYKTNWDGRKQKCTSITIRDVQGFPIGLICFNLDTSAFQGMQLNLATLLAVKNTAENPIELFKNNWQEQIDDHIEQFLTSNHTQLRLLSTEQKKVITRTLYQHGLFNYKNAAVYIAEKLDISRATVYNYLKA
jgi:predicted transcriptional regulator YheO